MPIFVEAAYGLWKKITLLFADSIDVINSIIKRFTMNVMMDASRISVRYKCE